MERKIKINNYNKRAGFYAVTTVSCMLIFTYLLMMSLLVKAKILTFGLSQIFLLLTGWFMFLTFLEGRDYKLKYYFLGKNKQKIQEYCELMNFDKKQTKATKWIMVDRYRKTGRAFTVSEYFQLFYKRQSKFEYKTATDSDKLEHILWYLKKALFGELKINSFCELLSIVGFSKQEIKKLIDESPADERLKKFVLGLTKKKKIDFTTLYTYEVDMDAFLLLHFGAIDAKEYKKMLDGHFSPLHHIRFEIVEEKDCCTLSQNMYRFGEWKTILKNKVFLNIDCAVGYIGSNLTKIAEMENWDFAWYLWSADKLTESFSLLLVYYQAIESSGHLEFFSENENLQHQIKCLKEILPATFYRNLTDAVKRFENKQSLDKNDKYFNDNAEKLKKIILEAIDYIVE